MRQDRLRHKTKIPRIIFRRRVRDFRRHHIRHYSVALSQMFIAPSVIDARAAAVILASVYVPTCAPHRLLNTLALLVESGSSLWNIVVAFALWP